MTRSPRSSKRESGFLHFGGVRTRVTRCRDPGTPHVVRRRGRRRRSRPDDRPRHHHRRARPQRRREDHDAGDLRGVPAAAGGRRTRAGAGPVGRAQGAAPPDRRDAPAGRRVERRARDGDAAAHRRACTRTRWTSTRWASAWGCRAAGGRRTDGSPAASSSGSAWRWPSSGRPELVFVDEPTAGMDPQARHITWDLLRELREAGVTVVLTTHYIEEAERLADQVHIIDRGRLVVSGTPSELHRRRRTAARGRVPGQHREVARMSLDLSPLPAPHRWPSRSARRRRWRSGCCCATASSCCWPS